MTLSDEIKHFNLRHQTRRSKIGAVVPRSLENIEAVLSQLQLDARKKPVSCHVDHNSALQNWFEPDEDGDNALILAILHQRDDIANFILDHIPNASYLEHRNTNGQTALHLAVILRLAELVRRLVAWGAPVVCFDTQGNTPLHIACRNGDLDSVQALTTPVTYFEVRSRPYQAAYQRIPQDLSLRNYDGYSCLYLSVIKVHFKVMDYLINHFSADINITDAKTGETLLHYAVRAGNSDLAKYILGQRSCQVNALRYDGLTALDLCHVIVHSDIYAMLVQAGALAVTNDYLTNRKPLSLEYDDICIDGVPLDN